MQKKFAHIFEVDELAFGFLRQVTHLFANDCIAFCVIANCLVDHIVYVTTPNNLDGNTVKAAFICVYVPHFALAHTSHHTILEFVPSDVLFLNVSG